MSLVVFHLDIGVWQPHSVVSQSFFIHMSGAQMPSRESVPRDAAATQAPNRFSLLQSARKKNGIFMFTQH